MRYYLNLDVLNTNASIVSSDFAEEFLHIPLRKEWDKRLTTVGFVPTKEEAECLLKEVNDLLGEICKYRWDDEYQRDALLRSGGEWSEERSERAYNSRKEAERRLRNLLLSRRVKDLPGEDRVNLVRNAGL